MYLKSKIYKSSSFQKKEMRGKSHLREAQRLFYDCKREKNSEHREIYSHLICLHLKEARRYGANKEEIQELEKSLTECENLPLE